MDKDTELTAYLLRYLYDNRFFKTKDEMARAFGVSKRQIQRLVNNHESSKGGSIALSKILNYFGAHEIPFDTILSVYLGKSVQIEHVPKKAYTQLYITMPEGLSTEGEHVFNYCRDFLCLLSMYICPNCMHWCNPWDGRDKLKYQTCFVAQTAKALVRSIEVNYTQEGEHHDTH